jgi:hypothetical protein
MSAHEPARFRLRFTLEPEAPHPDPVPGALWGAVVPAPVSVGVVVAVEPDAPTAGYVARLHGDAGAAALAAHGRDPHGAGSYGWSPVAAWAVLDWLRVVVFGAPHVMPVGSPRPLRRRALPEARRPHPEARTEARRPHPEAGHQAEAGHPGERHPGELPTVPAWAQRPRIAELAFGALRDRLAHPWHPWQQDDPAGPDGGPDTAAGDPVEDPGARPGGRLARVVPRA